MKISHRTGGFSRAIKILILSGIIGIAVFFGIRRFLLGKPVETVQPRKGPMVERIVLTGRVITPGTSKLGVSLLGTVTEVSVEEGDQVSAGRPLLRLEDGEQRAAVMQARAGLASAEANVAKVRRISGRVESANVEEARVALAQAERELGRTDQLVESGAADRKALETARDTVATLSTRLQSAKIRAEGAKGPEFRSASARVEEAKAALALAETRLLQTVLVAPTNGLILERNVEAGDIVQPGKILFTMAQEGPLRLEADADEKNLSLMKPDLEADVVADGFPNKIFSARLSWIAPSVDAQRGTITVRFEPEGNLSTLRPDMTVSINLKVSQPREALLIPLSAVQDDATDHPWVLVLEENRARRRSILLGFRDGKEVEVLSGLSQKSLLINDSGIADGAKVRVGDW